ncbi:flagellar hook-length control protein FliK [Yoonia sp.]|uniref:flagellar hook-length control protein FliK n=1 Tax=Yoonia sp. TaxID=2212373 RepID=UPI001A0679A6|nr:flagellar hook-length control protein FliK [Yoonia sp.]MBE0413769.1 flagellar hook-length control protein FliK [Yoonia sp.]
MTPLQTPDAAWMAVNARSVSVETQPVMDGESDPEFFFAAILNLLPISREDENITVPDHESMADSGVLLVGDAGAPASERTPVAADVQLAPATSAGVPHHSPDLQPVGELADPTNERPEQNKAQNPPMLAAAKPPISLAQTMFEGRFPPGALFMPPQQSLAVMPLNLQQHQSGQLFGAAMADTVGRSPPSRLPPAGAVSMPMSGAIPAVAIIARPNKSMASGLAAAAATEAQASALTASKGSGGNALLPGISMQAAPLEQDQPAMAPLLARALSQMTNGQRQGERHAKTEQLPDIIADPIASERVVIVSQPQNAIAAPTPSGGEMIRHVAGQMAVVLSGQSGQTTEIALNPEELGRVRMTMTVADQSITLHVLADRPETTDLMRRHIDALTQEFRALGYDNIAFSFGGDGGAADADAQPKPAFDAVEPNADAIVSEMIIAPQVGSNSSLDMRL